MDLILKVDPRILEQYVVDAPRSGRPTEDRAGREKSSEYLADEARISQLSALRIVKQNNVSA